MDSQAAYDELIRRAREHSLLGSCSAMLSWDEQTYMPSGGAGHRGGQMALLAGLHHERATDPRIGELLAMVEGSGLAARADSVRRGERSRAAAELRSPGPAAASTGRGAGADDLAGPAGMGRRAVGQRFRPVSSLAGKDHPSQARRSSLPGRVASASGASAPGGQTPALPTPVVMLRRQFGLRPLARRIRAGANSAELAILFQALQRELVPLVAAITEAARRKAAEVSGRGSVVRSWRRGDPQAALSARPPEDLRRDGGRGGRLRLRARPARRDGPPVLLGHWTGRLPDHDPLRRAPFQRRVFRHPARGRPRPLRAGAGPRALRNADG